MGAPIEPSADRNQRRSNPAPIDPRSIGEGQGGEVQRFIGDAPIEREKKARSKARVTQERRACKSRLEIVDFCRASPRELIIVDARLVFRTRF
jgi:hypothetical protein